MMQVDSQRPLGINVELLEFDAFENFMNGPCPSEAELFKLYARAKKDY
jgi:hypothetical protein